LPGYISLLGYISLPGYRLLKRRNDSAIEKTTTNFKRNEVDVVVCLNHLITKILDKQSKFSNHLCVPWFLCLQRLCKHGNQGTRNHCSSV
jgi:hypothetical protein